MTALGAVRYDDQYKERTISVSIINVSGNP